MITWIAGWPHNGSTILRQILKDCFEIQTHSIYPEPNFEYLFGPRAATFGEEWKGNPIVRAEYYNSLSVMHIIKTHDLPDDDNPALFVVRDGRDVVTSMSYFWKISIRLVIAAIANQYGDWSAHYYAWNPAKRKNTKIIRFEDMVLRPDDVAKAVGDFIGAKPLKPYVDDFEENVKKWPQLFHDRIGCWKKEMSKADLRLFHKCHGKLNRELGYE